MSPEKAMLSSMFGAGFGGDLQKWRDQGAHINMCDPDHSALEEAKKRARNMKINVNFL